MAAPRGAPASRRPGSAARRAAAGAPGTSARRPAAAGPTVNGRTGSAPAAPADGERINRHLAARGGWSRRAADALVAAGRVTVDGRRAVVGTIVRGAAAVAVDGRPLPPLRRRRTLLLNKPPGVVSTRRDPAGRPAVLDLVDDPDGLFPVGRLDTPSRGLLLLTTDGDLALRLTHPRHGVVKRYEVAVHGHAGPALLRRMVAGVDLDDGPAAALEARLLRSTPGGDVLEVAMGEGRRREVRRMLSALGLRVLDLRRTAVGPLRLGRLHEGQARPLTVAEERSLYEAVGLAPPGRRR